MTVITGLLEVLAVEFVPGIPVMIKNRLVPTFLLMTGVTVITKPVGMNIPDRMAIDTLLGGIRVFRLEVAGITGHLLV